MAVGSALLRCMNEVRLGERYRNQGGPVIVLQPTPRVEAERWMQIRSADIRLTTLLKPAAAEEYLNDICAARSEKDQAAIGRLKEYAKAIDLPKEGEDIPIALPWKIVQQIGGLDIAWLTGKKFPIDGHDVRIIDVRPGKLTFGITVKARVEGDEAIFYVKKQGGFGCTNVQKISTEIEAEILSEWVKFRLPSERRESYGSSVYDPNDENVSGKWQSSYMRPTSHSSFGEDREFEKAYTTYEIANLNLRQIVLGLLKEIVDNGYLLGSQGR